MISNSSVIFELIKQLQLAINNLVPELTEIEKNSVKDKLQTIISNI